MTNTEQLIQDMADDMNFASVEHDLWPDDAREIAKTLIILGYGKLPDQDEVQLAREQMARKCIGRMIKLMYETGDFNLYNRVIDFAKELQLLEENE
jgi:hypothetical protein